MPISAVQFLQPDFDRELAGLLEEYGIPAEKLALEITESTLINSFVQVNYMMQQVAEMGVELVLSDFGTGYSASIMCLICRSACSSWTASLCSSWKMMSAAAV